MKKTIRIYDKNGAKEQEINYIPVRYILAIALTVLEVLAVLAAVILCALYIPYFYIAMYLTEIFCILKIINSKDNPEYKIPWLLVVILIPVAGFMIYFLFYERKLSKKDSDRMKEIAERQVKNTDADALSTLENDDISAYQQANLLCRLSHTNLYRNTDATYYEMGEKLFAAMLDDLKKAEKFIFLEYFIIEEGIFWNGLLNVLKKKAAQGVDVRVIYDDIGCMCTLPGDYYKQLARYNIKAMPFFRLKGQANNEFNNRTHRKIMVIDGKVGYTGGVNLADEYINEKVLFGVWKDVGIRLEGEAVAQLTSIFLGDYELNRKKSIEDFSPFTSVIHKAENDGYVIPFGDGPHPVFKRRVAHTMITEMLSNAHKYVYIMTPYLIIDHELCQALENAALRGVDVRIITPHIPDKKLIFIMTQSNYKRLIDAGVRIFEYEPGFVHAKVYLSDDRYAIVGTINMDYRSLVHHFENGIWLYKHAVIEQIYDDIQNTLEQSVEINEVKNTPLQRLLRAIVQIFAPML